MAKGAAFERSISGALSLWWTGGKSDEVFWRSSGSGSRATNRKKAGKSTNTSVGDIASVDPVGAPLLKFFTLELKKNCGNYSLTELIMSHQGIQGKEGIRKLLSQAEVQGTTARSKSWALIYGRKGKVPTLICPAKDFPYSAKDLVKAKVKHAVVYDYLREAYLLEIPLPDLFTLDPKRFRA